MAGRKQIGWWVILLVLVVGFQSCKDNSTGIFGGQEQEMSGPAPQITSVTPDSGKFGEQVVIAGSNFGATSGENTVTFNGVEADIISGSANELLVEVPKAAGVGPVAVSTGGQTGTGPEFDYILTITVSTYAGTQGAPGLANGDAASAQFNNPIGVALGPDGNLFVTDYENHRIRRITPEGLVTTFAGSTSGYADGVGTNAQFNSPFGITISAAGELYISDRYNHRIRKITTAGAVTTLAGDGTPGFLDGVGTNARFSGPVGLDLDTDGNLYVGDENNNSIRKITPAAEVTTLAGDGTGGYVDGDGAVARFILPYGVTVDESGDVYVADFSNDLIRSITPAGVVSTFSGIHASNSFTDGPLGQAEFNGPVGIATSDNGRIFITDYQNHSIRMISGGEVTTIAGDGTGYVDGDGADARFARPIGITTNSDGSVLYIGEDGNDVIRKITLE